MKFILLVEGPVDRQCVGPFIKRWLDPQLRRPVGIEARPIKGTVHWDEVAKRARRHLLEDAVGEIIAVIGLADLHGSLRYPPGAQTARERYDWAKPLFERTVDHDRFQMFFAVHELEAWLLSDPSIFPRVIADALPQAAIQHPEAKNFDEPPAKFLNRLYLQHTHKTFKKTTHGPQLFAKLHPQTALDKCPRLREMLEDMLQLARQAGL